MDISELSRHSSILDACRRTHADVHVGMTIFTAGVVLRAICQSQPVTEMGSRAKTGVMHINLGIIDSLDEVMKRQETGMITGRISFPGLRTPPANRGAAVPSGQVSVAARRVLAPRPSTTATGLSESRVGRVLEPIQEGNTVFRQRISAPATMDAMEPQSTVPDNRGTDGDQATIGTFNWDGDMSALVDSALVDASQLSL